MKIVIETLGCKLNQAESENLTRKFAIAGFETVTQVEEADIYILNTCTVTRTADRKSRHLLRQARRRNPAVRIVVTGCYAERAPFELAKLDAVDIVTGNEGKMSLLELLKDEGFFKTTESSLSTLKNPARRTRAFIKIQDGCRNYCAYCIVPYVRRNETSIRPDEIFGQIRQRVEEGYREVVLTGTKIGTYQSNGLELKDLIKRILAETDILRLRLSSLQPREISPGLLQLWQDARLCPHFHLSLQSGSDTVLKRMRRRYTTGEFENTVALIKAIIPGVAITTDIIIGFPGESDAEFNESLEFARRMNFARIHVFPFSPRPGTEAAQMPGQTPETTKKERLRLMLALAGESARNFREQFTGDELDVLWEKQTGEGFWSGVTGNYLRVYKKDLRNLSNKVSTVKLDRQGNQGG